jgi:hypothetical protein
LQEEVGVVLPHYIRFARFQQLLGRILPHCLQQSVACRGAMLVHYHKRLVYQTRQQIENLLLFNPCAGAYGLDSFQRPTPSKQHPLLISE